MAELNIAILARIRSHPVGEDILANLDRPRRIVHIILRINIEVHNMIPQLRHIIQAPTHPRTSRVGRTQVLGKPAKDIPESHLVVHDLLGADLVGRVGEVLVCPGVRGELVAERVHPAQDLGVAGGFVVDLAFAEVVADDEEGGFDVVGFEEVEDVVGVFVGAVVEG